MTGTKPCENAPFGKEPAQEIGDLEGHQEGVHQRAGPEHLGIDHFPNEAR